MKFKNLTAFQGYALCQAKLSQQSKESDAIERLLIHFPLPDEKKYTISQLFGNQNRERLQGFSNFIEHCDESQLQHCGKAIERLLLYLQKSIELLKQHDRDDIRDFFGDLWTQLVAIGSQNRSKGQKWLVTLSQGCVGLIFEYVKQDVGKLQGGDLKAYQLIFQSFSTSMPPLELNQMQDLLSAILNMSGSIDIAGPQSVFKILAALVKQGGSPLVSFILGLPVQSAEKVDPVTLLAKSQIEKKGPTISCLELIAELILLNSNLIGSNLTILFDFVSSYFQVAIDYTQDNLDPYHYSLEAIKKIGLQLPETTQRIVDFFLNLMLTYGNFNPPPNKFLRDSALDAFCPVLKKLNEISPESVNYIFTTLHSHSFQAQEKHLLNLQKLGTSANKEEAEKNKSSSSMKNLGSYRVHSRTQTTLRDEQPTEKIIKQENICVHLITVQGTLARYLKDPDQLDTIVPQFLKRIVYPPTSVDDALIDQCMKFCFLNLRKPYENIISEFTDIFKRIVNDPESEKVNIAFSSLALPVTLTNLAKHIAPEFKEDLLRRILDLFLQLGKDVIHQSQDIRHDMQDKKKAPKKVNPFVDKFVARNLPAVQALGYLLPSIAQLIEDFPPFTWGLGSSEARLFRTFWYYCTLFQFVEPTEWRADWAAATRKIGCLIQPLVGGRPQFYTQMDRERKELLASFSERDITPYREALVRHLPESVKLIKGFSPADILHILAIFHLETGRAQCRGYTPCFSYLEDPGLPHTHNEHREIFKMIADKSRSFFLNRSLPLPQKAKILEAESMVLLAKTCSVYPEAAKLATDHLELNLSQMPHLAWNQNLLNRLFYLIQNVSQAISNPLISYIEIDEGKIPLPEETKDLNLLSRTLIDLAESYIKSGLENVPNLLLTILNNIQGNFAVSALSEILSGQKVRAKNNMNWMAVCIERGTTKRHFEGTISGGVSFLSQGKSDSNSIAKAESLIKKQIQEAFSSLAAQEEPDMMLYKSVMYQAVAFLKRLENPSLELIRSLCQLPLLIFTEQALKIAVECWSWLVIARPDVEHLLMYGLSNSWILSVDKKKGIFCDAVSELNPIDVSLEEVHPSSSSPIPHRIFLDFLHERILVTSNLKSVSNLFKIFRKSLLSNQTSSPVALGTRFKLLSTILEFVHSGKLGNIVKENVLRELAYQNCLSFYCQRPGHHAPEDEDYITDDLVILVDFIGQLQKEDKMEKSSRDPNQTTSSSVVAMSPLVLAESRRVIIGLVLNDIERTMTWKNPLAEVTANPDVDLSSLPRKPTADSLLKHAWNISPRLAFSVAFRFKHTNTTRIHQILEDHVLRKPHAILDIPEAVPYLVTPNNVAKDIPQLKWLIYCAPVDPPTALSFLYKDYLAHPTVTLYAVRVLHSFSPQTIIYYIPQLIQSLRYDKTEEVLRYLVKAAQESDLLAHQLIWNCQTYTEATDKASIQLKEPAGKLLKQIIENFSGTSKLIYEDVFSFLDEVTQISDMLLGKGANKDERQPFLAPALEKVKIKPGPLYLPTNPNTKVHGVVPEQSFVLQSSKKAPILVTFKCHSRQDETEDEKKELVWSNPFNQGLIFKTGDDVRQDMLAVQLIELFKRIFRSVGLDAFVFPYKIIATKPEQGLIEVVPRASSRDQIGKKIDGSLLDYFLYKYGPFNSPEFQKARRNLIVSMAGYAVVSYILQVKDRHNGNIMINEDGHLIHIDFGFIFDSSPGKNVGWEVSPFKMTNEIIAIVGGKDGTHSETYRYFEELTVRAFLAARKYSDSIITLVEFMLDTELPCFRGKTISRLLTRLVPDVSEPDAARHMRQLVKDATSAFSKTAGLTYDIFQNKVEGIQFAQKVELDSFY